MFRCVTPPPKAAHSKPLKLLEMSACVACVACPRIRQAFARGLAALVFAECFPSLLLLRDTRETRGTRQRFQIVGPFRFWFACDALTRTAA